MLKSASEVVAVGGTVEVVDMAVELNREINRLTRELDVLKAALREKGVFEVALTGANNVTFEGTLGTAQVAAVRPTPRAKKGVDLLASESNLPAEVWGALFTKRIVVEIADDYEAKVAALPIAQRAVLGNLVEVVGSTPRVNLK